MEEVKYVKEQPVDELKNSKIETYVTLGDVSTEVMFKAFSVLRDSEIAEGGGQVDIVMQVRCSHSVGRKVDRLLSHVEDIEDIESEKATQYSLLTTPFCVLLFCSYFGRLRSFR